MPGTAHALQAARDAGWGLDLYDEVDRAHVDAELQGGGGDHGGQARGLEVLLDDGALLATHRAVVGARQRQVESSLLGDLVEPAGESLGKPAGVREDDARALLRDEIDDTLLDMRPDGRAARIGGRRPVDVEFLTHRRHVGDRHDDREIPGLLCGRRDDRDLALGTQEARHFAVRLDRGGEPDALSRAAAQLIEALEREGEVRAALGAGECVHLVDDHGAHVAEDRSRLRGEEEEERLRRRDEDVGWGGGHAPALVGRGIAGAHADADVGHRQAEALRLALDAREGCAQVALDVDGECLERRYVEDARSGDRVARDGIARQVVDGRQEGREGLARAGGSDDEGVAPGFDRLPRERLSRGWGGERRLEPRAGRGGEVGHRPILVEEDVSGVLRAARSLIDGSAVNDDNDGMAVMTIRNLDEGVRDKLRVRAALHGRSMEAEARAILTAAVDSPMERSLLDVLSEMRGILDGEELQMPSREGGLREPFA